jgi:hypothetical protein
LLEIWVEHGDDEKTKMDIAEKLNVLLNVEHSKLNFYFKKHDLALKV